MRPFSCALIASSFVLAMCFTRIANAADPAADQGTVTPVPPPTTVPAYGYENNRRSMTAEREEDGLLFGPGIRHGGYAAPELKVTSFAGDTAMLVGVQGGWIIQRRVVIGAAGYGLATDHAPSANLARGDAASRIGFGYGGARVAFVLNPQRIIHMNMGLLIGGGGVTITSHSADTGRAYAHDSAAVFAIEPQAEIELNVASFVRVATSVSYRFIGDTNTSGLESSDLSGVGAGLAVKLGYF